MIERLIGMLVIGMFAALSVSAGAQIELEEMRQRRKEAAHKKRRIIMNNDGNEPVYYCKKVDRDEFLSLRTAPLAGSQVDAVFYPQVMAGRIQIDLHGVAHCFARGGEDGAGSRQPKY